MTNPPPQDFVFTSERPYYSLALFQESYARAHLAKKNLHKKKLSITFGRNIQNMLIIGLCHR